MNWYRNAHYMLCNRVKQEFWPLEFAPFRAEKISVDYTLVWNNRRRTDRMNWIVLADKFLLDWLVKCEYIPDDDVDHYVETIARHIIDRKAKQSYIIANVKIL